MMRRRFAVGYWSPAHILALILGLFAPGAARGADVVEAEQLLRSGKYAECIELTAKAIADREYSESWRILKIQAEMAVGKYADALATLEQALERYSRSVRLRWLGHFVYLHNDRSVRAELMLDEIQALATRSPWNYADPASRIALGRLFLHRGADPRDVLEAFFRRVKKDQPDYVDAYIASGQLALDKHDYQLAAEEFQQAARLDEKDPEVQLGLARAFVGSDSKLAEQALNRALELNPNHVDSLLFVVDQHIDAERYAEAEELIRRVVDINAQEPRAWAYRAVMAHLDSRHEDESSFRQKALSSWRGNPGVDCLIGTKLSQKYRFAEGATYQRRALTYDKNFLPAKTQLSQDLLRLGRETEGWQLASESYAKDGYNVVAHNLVTLEENMSKFRTLQSDDFIVRMDAQEAEVYGQRVLDLLARARKQLLHKYDVQLDEPVIVEIFPHQQDFAIRTFGLPGGAGFLGVCFGNVITANSPASQADSPSNWEAVLWHEFCHVVTLNKTGNKMPRWLSEGISVYEEQQADRTWGQALNPKYREMMLGDDLTPVSQLSAAFLEPPTPLHLQFAYYESSLVVEYLVEQYGLETLKRILVDLGVGMPLNESLQRHTGSLEELDKNFAAFARQRAEALAPGADWAQPELPRDADSEQLAAWVEAHPDNYWGLYRWAQQLIKQQEWEAAKVPLERLIELYPDDSSNDSARRLLATVHRNLGETSDECAVLEEVASLEGDAADVYLRLLELSAEASDWPAVIRNAQRLLAVNPLQPAPHRYLADAAEHLDDLAQQRMAWQSLVALNPVDVAGAHYKLGQLLRRSGDLHSARLHILKSLEEAPRFREAHRELLEVHRQLDSARGAEAKTDSSGSGDVKRDTAAAPTPPSGETGASPETKREPQKDDRSGRQQGQDVPPREEERP